MERYRRAIALVDDDDAVIAQTFWRSVFVSRTKRVKGIYAHVAFEHHYNKVWLA